MNPRPDHGEDRYRGHGRLEGKTALITGGDSGIGRAVALAYAREGADVAFTFLPAEQEDADATVEFVSSAGRRPVPISADLRTSEKCDEVVAQTVDAFGGLDILVNNAGYQMTRTGEGIEDVDDERLDRVMKTNLYALFWMIRAAIPHLKRSKGCIINNTSIQAYEPSTTLLGRPGGPAGRSRPRVRLPGLAGRSRLRVRHSARCDRRQTRLLTPGSVIGSQ